MTDHANELRRHARKIPYPQGETPGVMLRAADEIERLQSVITSPYIMTRDDIIRVARGAGFRAGHIELYGSDPMPFVAPCSATDCMPELEHFAGLVAAAEREACAITAWSISMDLHNKQFDSREIGAHCAAAIRSRGNQ